MHAKCISAVYVLADTSVMSARHSYNLSMQGVVDLHCHSRWSDGTLEAAEVVKLAAGRGVNLLALTDHDETGGLAEARQTAVAAGIEFVSGVEVSAQWNGIPVHVVGLRVDEGCERLQQLLADTRDQRRERARSMADALAAAGVAGAFEGAVAYAPNPNLISRTHFARFLVDSGVCSNVGEVFTRFMKPGKPGYVRHEWLPLDQAIAVIREAGGRAVLAHPGRYDYDVHAGPELLVRAFAGLGGEAVEVVCAAHNPQEWAQYAALTRRYDLLSSIGSDFHSPLESRVKFGDLPRLSPSLKPVWHDWPEAERLHA